METKILISKIAGKKNAIEWTNKDLILVVEKAILSRNQFQHPV